MPALPEQIDRLLRFFVAYSAIFILFFLNMVPVSISLTGRFEVPLMIMVIYYWSIYRPTLIPAWLAFVMGVFLDFLSGFPVGLSAFVFVGLRWIIVDQRLFLMGQSFFTVWIGFALACLGAVIVEWILIGLVQWNWMPLLQILMMFVAGVFVFPLISIFLHFSHRLLPEQSDFFSMMRK